jgi:hypothetical protein
MIVSSGAGHSLLGAVNVRSAKRNLRTKAGSRSRTDLTARLIRPFSLAWCTICGGLECRKVLDLYGR